ETGLGDFVREAVRRDEVAGAVERDELPNGVVEEVEERKKKGRKRKRKRRNSKAREEEDEPELVVPDSHPPDSDIDMASPPILSDQDDADAQQPTHQPQPTRL